MGRFIMMNRLIPELKTFTADWRYVEGGKKKQLQGTSDRKS